MFTLKKQNNYIFNKFCILRYKKTLFKTAENICRKILNNTGSIVRHFWASSYNKGSVAEWSKALVLGTSPKGRGFESHRCQKSFSSCFLTFFIWKSFINSQEKSEIVGQKTYIVNSRKMNFVYIIEHVYVMYVIVTWCAKTWRTNYPFIFCTTK